MKRRLLLVATVAISSGWVIPLYFSFQFLLDWCKLEAAPVIYGKDPGANSFPFLAEAGRWWFVAVSWVAIVTIFWSAVGASRLFPKRLDPPA